MGDLMQWLSSLVSDTADPISQTLFYLFLALLSAAECIGGWRLLRWQIGGCGALAGAVLGYAVGWRGLGLPLSFPGVIPTLLLALACGAIGAWIAVRIYRFGVFCLGFLLGCCGFLLLHLPLWTGLVAGMMLGTLAAWLLRPAVTLLTAAAGAVLTARYTLAIFGGAPRMATVIFSALLFFFGVIYQWYIGKSSDAAQDQRQRPPATKTNKK